MKHMEIKCEQGHGATYPPLMDPVDTLPAIHAFGQFVNEHHMSGASSNDWGVEAMA